MRPICFKKSIGFRNTYTFSRRVGRGEGSRSCLWAGTFCNSSFSELGFIYFYSGAPECSPAVVLCLKRHRRYGHDLESHSTVWGKPEIKIRTLGTTRTAANTSNQYQKITHKFMFIVILLLSHLVSWDRCGTWLYQFLILAVFFTYI